MASIGDVANRLLASPVPVLLADTCVLLDIVRVPRLAIAQHLRAVNAIRQSAADAPPRCALVTASIAEKSSTTTSPRKWRP